MSRYKDLCHAMQSGVALKMNFDPRDTAPKHLRVGVNSAMCDNAALARLLVEKGVITWDEYERAITDEMVREVERYRQWFRDRGLPSILREVRIMDEQKQAQFRQEHREQVAFEGETRGYRFVATYLTEPKGEALIEISKGGEMVRAFLWPAYKIWNIAAHADDIVESLEAGNSDGLYAAGATGFGGNVYSE